MHAARTHAVRWKAGVLALTGLLLAAAAQAKGSGGPPNPCSISLLNCPITIPAGSGSLSDELVNGSVDPITLAIAYAVPQLGNGSEESMTLTGPGSGANTLPFVATASLSAYDTANQLLFTLTAVNFDASGAGGSGYLNPVSQTINGVTLSESVAAFEGGISFIALNGSGGNISLKLDLTIPAAGFGQVTVTNAYAAAPIPEPGTALLGLVGFALLAGLVRIQR